MSAPRFNATSVPHRGLAREGAREVGGTSPRNKIPHVRGGGATIAGAAYPSRARHHITTYSLMAEACQINRCLPNFAIFFCRPVLPDIVLLRHPITHASCRIILGSTHGPACACS